MAWKWFKNERSIAGFLLFFAQLAWAIYLISLFIYSIFFLIEVFIGTPMGVIDLSARIYIQDFTEIISNSETDRIFDKAFFETNVNTLGIEITNKWSYYLALAMTVGLNGIALYGLSLLKRILESLQREQPWDQKNSKNLRIIGYLMVLAVPYKYGIGWLSYLTIQQLTLPESISLLWPPIAWEIGLAGLAVILVAYIFEEGTRLYEEQKLTV